MHTSLKFTTFVESVNVHVNVRSSGSGQENGAGNKMTHKSAKLHADIFALQNYEIWQYVCVLINLQ